VKSRVALPPRFSGLEDQEVRLDRRTARVDLQPASRSVAFSFNIPWAQLSLAPLTRGELKRRLKAVTLLTPRGPVGLRVAFTPKGLGLKGSGLSPLTFGQFSKHGLVATLQLKGTSAELRIHVPEVELHSHGADGWVPTGAKERFAPGRVADLRGEARALAELDHRKIDLLLMDAEDKVTLPPRAYTRSRAETLRKLRALERSRKQVKSNYRKLFAKLDREVASALKAEKRALRDEALGKLVMQLPDE
jgi:hypothetical protein